VAADVVVLELDMRPARMRVGAGFSAANRGEHDARLMRGPAEICAEMLRGDLCFGHRFNTLLFFRCGHVGVRVLLVLPGCTCLPRDPKMA
jgi:hypothetical protein